MRLSYRQLKKMIVETVSGEVLGRVTDIVMQTEDQLVAQYHVRSSVFGGASYMVSRDQVVRFEETKLIVDDAVVRSAAKPSHAQKKRLAQDPEPIAMREE